MQRGCRVRDSGKREHVFVQIAKCICPNYKMPITPCSEAVMSETQGSANVYLSKLLNVFVQIVKFICPNYKMPITLCSEAVMSETQGSAKNMIFGWKSSPLQWLSKMGTFYQYMYR